MWSTPVTFGGGTAIEKLPARVALGLRMEIPAFVPPLEDAPLDLRGVVASRALERLFGLVVHPGRC